MPLIYLIIGLAGGILIGFIFAVCYLTEKVEQMETLLNQAKAKHASAALLHERAILLNEETQQKVSRLAAMVRQSAGAKTA